MAQCEVCGNHYDRSFRVRFDADPEREHVFDCFECAVHRLAPRCAHCGCGAIGHGVECGKVVYCCDHCRRAHQRASADDGVDEASRESFPASDAPAAGCATGVGEAPR